MQSVKWGPLLEWGLAANSAFTVPRADGAVCEVENPGYAVLLFRGLGKPQRRGRTLGTRLLVASRSMEAPFTVAVEIPLVGDERRKNWAKVVTNVDDSLATGWAFDGEFIATGGIQDVEPGCVVLVYGEKGSRANPAIEARVYTVHADATLSLRASARGRAWARTLRDTIEDLLAEVNETPLEQVGWTPDLLRYSDEALVEEIKRRGLS